MYTRLSRGPLSSVTVLPTSIYYPCAIKPMWFGLAWHAPSATLAMMGDQHRLAHNPPPASTDHRKDDSAESPFPQNAHKPLLFFFSLLLPPRIARRRSARSSLPTNLTKIRMRLSTLNMCTRPRYVPDIRWVYVLVRTYRSIPYAPATMHVFFYLFSIVFGNHRLRDYREPCG